MAALSFCSNWEMLNNQQQLLFQETEPELLAPELNHVFTLADTSIDPLFQPANEFLLPHFWPPHDDDPSNNYDHSISLTPVREFHNHVPKRQKLHYEHDDQFYSDISSIMPSCFLDGYVPSYSTTSPVLPNFSPAYGRGSAENLKKFNGGSLSAQSVAARRRRKKITEKTEELGKLVPGGRKMNTAEMFQAAFKYVKYLQAQVGILEFMGPIQKNDDPLLNQEDHLQVLLASPIIQEKLYSEEKCLVPERLVQNLANDIEIQSNPLIMSEIKQLFEIDG